MITFSEDQIAQKLRPADVLAAVRRAHTDLTLGNAENSVRQRVRAPGFSLHTLSASSKTLGLAAAKIYSATKTGVVSNLLLFSTKDGSLIASLPAKELGKRRTAATAVLGLVELLPAPTGEVALIGTGFQAWGLVEALHGLVQCSILPKLRLRVFGRTPDRRRLFCERARNELKLDAVECSAAREATQGADVLFLATTASAAVIEDSALTTLRFVCALGANALSRKELDARSVTRACQVIVDARDVARVEGGTLLPVVENGRLSWQEIVEIGEVISGIREKVPPTPGRYALLCTHGLAIQDLYSAGLLVGCGA